MGVSIDQVSVIGGDSAISPYGGGAWASRGTAIGGEAALRAGTMLKQNILALAGAITQTSAEALDVADGQVVNTRTGQTVISLADVGRIGYFRQDTLPSDHDPQLSVSASFVANDKLYYMANGVQASYVEVDCDTGFIKVLGQWAVDDCGRVINPLLVDEQVRGGIAQGIGAVLYEECIYSDDANLLNGTMADYLIPMSDGVPDIVVAHVETPEASTKLGAKGIGEAGLIGAMGAVWVAVNDALKPLGAKVLLCLEMFTRAPSTSGFSRETRASMTAVHCKCRLVSRQWGQESGWVCVSYSRLPAAPEIDSARRRVRFKPRRLGSGNLRQPRIFGFPAKLYLVNPKRASCGAGRSIRTSRRFRNPSISR